MRMFKNKVIFKKVVSKGWCKESTWVCEHDVNEPRLRKPAFCICENKDADQLCRNREADQRLCFRYIDSTIPLLFKPLAILCSCRAWFVWDLVGNPEDQFSHNEAQIMLYSDLRFPTDLRLPQTHQPMYDKARETTPPHISLGVRTI